MGKAQYLGSRAHVLDNSANAASNIYLKFTEPGDASTLKDVYSDSDLSTVLTNPVPMDAYGRKTIWLNGNYDVYTYKGDPDDPVDPGVLLYSDTNVNAINAAGVIDTLANLKAETDLPNGRVIYLNDSGRSGLFKFNTSNLSTEVTADTQNGIYVPPNSDSTGASGAWVRQYSGGADVKWFGATGSSDDTTAVQAALDSGVSVLDIKPGTYTCDPLTITTAIILRGRGGTIKAKAASTGNLVTVSANGVTIEKTIFDGNKANVTSKNIIHSTASDITIRNNTIFDASNIGVVIRGASSNCLVEGNKIYDCTFQHVLANASDGAMSNIIISDNLVYMSAFGENTGNGGIGSNAATNSITRLSVCNNVVDMPISTSAPVAQVGITTYGNVNDYVISDNVVTGGRIGISNGGAHNAACSGNTVSDPYEIGIEVATGGSYTCDNVIVDGNHIVGSDSGGTTNTKGIACTSSAVSSTVHNLLISNNSIRESFIPIQVSESSSGSVEDVSIVNNRCIMSSTNGRIDITIVENLTVKGNHIDLNGQTTATGIKLTDCDIFDVSNNFIFGSISGASGVALVGTSVDISHGTVKDNSFDGAGAFLSYTGYKTYTGETGVQDITGTLAILGNVGQTYPTRASGDGNPSVAQAEAMYLSGTSSITDLIHGYVGKEITIRSTGTPTITNGTPIRLNGSANFVMANGDIIRLKMMTSGVWEEISRMVR